MRTWLRRTVALIGLVGYAALIAAVPVVHAETEQLDAPLSLESGHSAKCPVIHVEAACGAGAVKPLAPPPLSLRPDVGAVTFRPATVVFTAVGTRPTASHPVRGPPSS